MELEQWMAKNASPEFRRLCSQQADAFEFLWARHNFVSSSLKNLYWFTVFDDLWCRNYEMAVLKDKAKEFGSSDCGSVVYTPLERPALEELLKQHDMLSSTAPKLFHDELLGRLYYQMEQA